MKLLLLIFAFSLSVPLFGAQSTPVKDSAGPNPPNLGEVAVMPGSSSGAKGDDGDDGRSTAGQGGESGENGEPGHGGGSYDLEVTSDNSLKVVGGHGGKGGDGGDGADGTPKGGAGGNAGYGGKGGDAEVSVCSGKGFALGGNGGKGGDGGNGGDGLGTQLPPHGGNGGDAGQRGMAGSATATVAAGQSGSVRAWSGVWGESGAIGYGGNPESQDGSVPTNPPAATASCSLTGDPTDC